MPRSNVMVLDSNAFIEPKNRFYAFDICPGYWEFVIDDFESCNAMSVTHVRNEILGGSDALSTWMKDELDKKYFFDCASDAKTVTEYQTVSSYVQAYYSKPNVVQDFLKPTSADPWLVAYSPAHGGTIVTQEAHKSRNKKVSLSDVCDHFRLHHINVFEFLRAEKAKFIYSKLSV